MSGEQRRLQPHAGPRRISLIGLITSRSTGSMRLQRLALSVGTMLVLFVVPIKADLACKASGYCSLGALSPFIGDLYPSARVTVAEYTQRCTAPPFVSIDLR